MVPDPGDVGESTIGASPAATVTVGLGRLRAGLITAKGDWGVLVVPMAVGSIIGAFLGRLLVAVTVAAIVKGLLGLALVASALRIVTPREQDRALGNTACALARRFRRRPSEGARRLPGRRARAPVIGLLTLGAHHSLNPC